MSLKRYIIKLTMSQTRRMKLIIISSLLIFLGLFYYHIFYKSQRIIPIYVVEEHHEVLPYWYDAVRDGLIKRTQNTLIHIDGHSDMNVPILYKGYPLFRYPKSPTEEDITIQRNDMFIYAAVIAGIFNRVIWIYPSWLKQEDDAKYTNTKISLGYIFKNKRYVCLCEENSNETSCYYVDVDKDIDDRIIPMEINECSTSTNFQFEIVEETEAIKMFKTDWLKNDDSIVVDFDLDYYGVELAYKPITKYNINWKKIEKLNRALDPFLCPRLQQHEVLGNAFLGKAAHYLLIAKQFESRNDTLRKYRKSLLKEYKRDPLLFCAKENAELMEGWKNLANAILDFSIKEFEIIVKKVRFCLSTSFKTFMPNDDSPGIVVCHGMNTPNDTVVQEHYPTPVETVKRTARLAKMLSGNIDNMKISTVCRSIRDGYTPRRLVAHLEGDALSVIRESVSTSKFLIYFDDFLLWGKLGWWDI
ncbi:DgyrCDS13970 [Dimorphilus gyrociliatus]|uniref:DgyrCDS13970 n=1 Tax=Dimorphilus gyrociliatus TaxID=2664684 RepID=A0A7I8WC58_9ANNE|nr:DgyrCDS13970 [Dimorphilus gyrociliatus]